MVSGFDGDIGSDMNCKLWELGRIDLKFDIGSFAYIIQTKLARI